MNEDKHKNFLRVAESRVGKILDMIRLLKNCSNRGNYDYTEADIDYMFSEINKALKEARDLYTQELSKKKPTKFSFNNN